MRFCPKCGAAIVEGYMFCIGCGEFLPAILDDEEVQVPEAPAEPDIQLDAVLDMVMEAEKKSAEAPAAKEPPKPVEAPAAKKQAKPVEASAVTEPPRPAATKKSAKTSAKPATPPVATRGQTSSTETPTTDNAKPRGWFNDVRSVMERMGDEFTLQDMYAYEDELAAKYPSNRNVRAQIRHQLQVLRDKGYVEFLGKGRYRKTSASTTFTPPAYEAPEPEFVPEPAPKPAPRAESAPAPKPEPKHMPKPAPKPQEDTLPKHSTIRPRAEGFGTNLIVNIAYLAPQDNKWHIFMAFDPQTDVAAVAPHYSDQKIDAFTDNGCPSDATLEALRYTVVTREGTMPWNLLAACAYIEDAKAIAESYRQKDPSLSVVVAEV